MIKSYNDKITLLVKICFCFSRLFNLRYTEEVFQRKAYFLRPEAQVLSVYHLMIMYSLLERMNILPINQSLPQKKATKKKGIDTDLDNPIHATPTNYLMTMEWIVVSNRQLPQVLCFLQETFWKIFKEWWRKNGKWQKNVARGLSPMYGKERHRHRQC